MNISVRQQSRNYQWKVKYGRRAPRFTSRDRRVLYTLLRNARIAVFVRGVSYYRD